jgi:cytochrome P450
MAETQIFSALVNRMVVNPAGFTFRNGLHLPYGTFVGIPTHSIHRDADYYANPLEFDGFRYSKMRNDNNESTKHQMVNTQLDYLNFGHGKHACPGRRVLRLTP